MSRLPFELFLALRYLRPKRTFVSVITLISILGVALGVAVLIIVISVMSGFDHELRDKILGFNAHLTVSQVRRHDEELCGGGEAHRAKQKCPRRLAVRLRPGAGGDRRRHERASLQDAPMLRGVDPATEGKVSRLPQKIMEGQI